MDLEHKTGSLSYKNQYTVLYEIIILNLMKRIYLAFALVFMIALIGCGPKIHYNRY